MPRKPRKATSKRTKHTMYNVDPLVAEEFRKIAEEMNVSASHLVNAQMERLIKEVRGNYIIETKDTTNE